MANFKNNANYEGLQKEPNQADYQPTSEDARIKLEDGNYDLYSVYLAIQGYFTKVYPNLFTTDGKYDKSPESVKARCEKVKNLLIKHINEQDYHIDGLSKEELCDKLYDELVGYSVLTKYIKDEKNEIEEINVNAWNDIEVLYSNGKTVKTEPFFNTSHAKDIIRRLINSAGSLIDNAMPMAEGSLTTNVRITALTDPIVDDEIGVACSIRLLKPQFANRDFFIKNGTITEEEMKFLELAIKSGVSIVFVGATGAGKTTLMNYLLTTIPNTKRIVTIEHNARELSLIKKDASGNVLNNVVHLKTRQNDNSKLNVSQEDLVAKALRLDPNVICVGEMRDSEAYAAQEASLTGHTVVSSLHADGVEATHYRIAMLALKRYQVDISIALLQAAMAFPLIVYISKLEDNSRKVMEIAECEVLEDNGESIRTYNDLYEYKILSNRIENGRYIIKGEYIKKPNVSAKMIKTMMRGGATVPDLQNAGIIMPK